MTTEKERFQVLLEEINEKLALLVDAVLSLGERVTRIEQEIVQINHKLDRLPPIEVVVSDHEHRITRLERKAA